MSPLRGFSLLFIFFDEFQEHVFETDFALHDFVDLDAGLDENRDQSGHFGPIVQFDPEFCVFEAG